MRVGQKVFRVDFQPARTRPGGGHFDDMRKSEGRLPQHLAERSIPSAWTRYSVTGL